MESKKYITIVLGGFFIIGSLALVVHATPSKAAATPQRIVFIGDSITSGESAGDSTKALVYRIEKINPNWFIKNYSYGGASVSGEGSFLGVPVAPGLNPAAPAGLFANTDVVLLGVADWLYSASTSTLQQKYNAFLDTLSQTPPYPFSLASSTKIICVTPIWIKLEANPNQSGIYLSEYRTIIKNTCEARGYPVIDGTALMPHLSSYFPDNVHPNSDGYAIFSTNLYNALRAYIPE